MENETVNITLSKPVTHNDETYSALTFREPEVGDLLIAEKSEGGMAQMVTLLASISGVPLPAFKKIKGRDLKRIIADTKDLLGNDQTNTTGE